jgi:hypothetical protein
MTIDLEAYNLWYEKNAYKRRPIGLEPSSEEFKRRNRINNWKRSDVKGDLEALYDRWLNETNCEVCGVSFEGIKKCLDHDHKTGEFRFILCVSCNNHDFWKKKTNPVKY